MAELYLGAVFESVTIYRGPSAPAYNSAYRSNGVPIAKILDGTTNTIAFGEILTNPITDGRHGLIYQSEFDGFSTSIRPNDLSTPDRLMMAGACTTLTAASKPIPCVVANGTTVMPAMGSRSAHAQGVNTSMADGSVRFVTNGVSAAAWKALGTARGGEVIDSSGF